jgi:hypothetical protein
MVTLVVSTDSFWSRFTVDESLRGRSSFEYVVIDFVTRECAFRESFSPKRHFFLRRREKEEEGEEKLVSRDKRHVFWSEDERAKEADRAREICGV